MAISGATIYVEFKTADGLMVCPVCGATYSGVLGRCPGCDQRVEYRRPVFRGKYLCDMGSGCDVGGPDDICCVSCSRFSGCEAPCHTAETWKGKPPEPDEILCEYMKPSVSVKIYPKNF